MTGLPDAMTASQIAAGVDSIRFDTNLLNFEFQPSIGIVAKALARLGDELQDMREPLTRAVNEVMTISILENFMSAGRPDWEDLSPATLERRAKNGSGTMILVRTGSLADVASSRSIWSIGKTTATIRDLPDKVWYGKVHQAGLAGNGLGGGSWFKKYKTAARKALGPDEDDKEVDKLAYKMFDQRMLKHGPAPQATSDIPARPFVMFQEEDIDAIQLIFVEWVEDKIREVGLR